MNKNTAISHLTALLLLFSAITKTQATAETPHEEAIRLNNLGVIKMNEGDNKSAIADFTVALQEEPEYPLPHTNRIIAKYRLHDYDGVLSDYENIRAQPRLLAVTSELMPDNLIAKCYVARGLAKQKLGNHLAAIECFNEAVRLAPNNAEYYHYRGVSEQKSGDAAGASNDFNKENLIHVKQEK